jgi:hypothetical protein
MTRAPRTPNPLPDEVLDGIRELHDARGSDRWFPG